MKGWTKVHSEVWDQIKENTKNILNGNIDAIEKNYHDDYLGWDTETILPVTKDDILNELRENGEREIINFSLSPIDISVFGKTAVVHYFYSVEYRDIVGVVHVESKRNSDILIKSENKWKVISDNCGI